MHQHAVGFCVRTTCKFREPITIYHSSWYYASRNVATYSLCQNVSSLSEQGNAHNDQVTMITKVKTESLSPRGHTNSFLRVSPLICGPVTASLGGRINAKIRSFVSPKRCATPNGKNRTCSKCGIINLSPAKLGPIMKIIALKFLQIQLNIPSFPAFHAKGRNSVWGKIKIY